MSEVNLLLKKRPKNKWKWMVIVGMLPILALAIWFLRPLPVAEAGKVERGRAVSAVYGTVLVEPIVQTVVRAQNSGVLSSVKVKKGDVVKLNQVLAEVSDDSTSQQLRSAQSLLENEQRKLEIGAASQPSLDAKKSQIDQLEKLFNEGNISKSEYDRNISELKTLEGRVQNEKLALEAAVEAAQQRLDAARSTAKQSFITSPQDGVILDFFAQLGQVINAREQIFLVGSSNCHLRAQVNEEDVGSLKVGMKAVVRLYSHPNRNFEATLKEILPQGKTMEYSVLLDIKDAPEPFLPGMTGELNIITGERENALIISSRAIRSNRTVFIIDNGVVHRREVVIGFRSIEKSEILEGLQEGDLVILSNHDLYQPGQRVKPRLRE